MAKGMEAAMKNAQIADGVREGTEQMETIDDLRQAIIANIEEVIGNIYENPDLLEGK